MPSFCQRSDQVGLLLCKDSPNGATKARYNSSDNSFATHLSTPKGRKAACLALNNIVYTMLHIYICNKANNEQKMSPKYNRLINLWHTLTMCMAVSYFFLFFKPTGTHWCALKFHFFNYFLLFSSYCGVCIIFFSFFLLVYFMYDID